MKHKDSRFYQVCPNDESRLTLTYFMAMSNLIPTVLWINLGMFIKLLTVKDETIILVRNISPNETMALYQN